jgi:hypothetical protein
MLDAQTAPLSEEQRPDLYSYLVSLSSLLSSVGEADAAEQVLHVSKFASGSTSELYGEARLLLPKLLQATGGKLPELDRARLRDVIFQPFSGSVR